MRRMRRNISIISTLLLLCVCSQLLDAGFCCDVEKPAERSASPTAIGVPLDAVVATTTTEHHDSSEQADCLCHLTFAPGGVSADLASVDHPSSLAAYAPDRLHSVLLSPPGHIPLV